MGFQILFILAALVAVCCKAELDTRRAAAAKDKLIRRVMEADIDRRHA